MLLTTNCKFDHPNTKGDVVGSVQKAAINGGDGATGKPSYFYLTRRKCGRGQGQTHESSHVRLLLLLIPH